MKTNNQDVIIALQPGKVEVGDIVLTSRPDLSAFVIRGATSIRSFQKADFSHAALCTRPDLLLEAVPDGVIRRSVFATYVRRPEWIKVLRPISPLHTNDEGQSLPYYAERLYGRPYAPARAVASIFAWPNMEETRSVFCSQLVAQTYVDYGRPLLPGVEPSKTYPFLLTTSKELQDVTSSCVRSISSHADSATYQTIIEAADAMELLSSEMQMNQRVFKMLKSNPDVLIPPDVYSLPDMWEWLKVCDTAVKEADKEILSTMERSGYFDWYSEFTKNVLSDASAIESLLMILERASTGAPFPRGEVERLVVDIVDTLQQGAVSVEGRRDTMNEAARVSSETGLATAERLYQKYCDEYEACKHLQDMKERLVSALRNLPITS